MEWLSLLFVKSFCGSEEKSYCGRNACQVPSPHPDRGPPPEEETALTLYSLEHRQL